VVENAQLPHEAYVVHLAALDAEHLALGHCLSFDGVLVWTVYYLSVWKAVVGQRVALGGELLLAPRVVAIGDEPCISLLAWVLGLSYCVCRVGLDGSLGRLLIEHFKEVVPNDSLLFAVGKRFLQEIRSFYWEGVSLQNVGYGNRLNPFQQLVLVPSLPWRIPKHHLVKYNPQRPNIALGGILHPLKNLWSHVDWAAHTGFEHLRAKVVHIFGESEISDLVDAIVDEDVGWFQVSVDDLLAD